MTLEKLNEYIEKRLSELRQEQSQNKKQIKLY